MAEKGKYLSKTVKFGGQTVTLFSIDGATWSTRKDELHTIQDRHDNERVTLAHIKGEVPDGSLRAKARAQPPRLAHSSATLQKSNEKGPGAKSSKTDVEPVVARGVMQKSPAPIKTKQAPKAAANKQPSKSGKKAVKQTKKATKSMAKAGKKRKAA